LSLGQDLPRLLCAVPGPRSVALVDRLSHCESPAITPHRPRPGLAGAALEDPPAWSQASGCNVVDVDGNVFVDLSAGFGVASVGHAHPAVVEAGQRQLARQPHAMGDVFFEPQRVELLEKLCALSGLDRVILGSSGADAVEAALKTARVATGRDPVLAFHGSYHGLSYGALAVTGFRRDFFMGRFAGQSGSHVRFAPFGGPVPDLEGFGAVLVEPIQGRGGVRVPPEGWLLELQQRAHDAGALLILDEIFTGCGRVGSWFAFQAEGLEPDLVCAGKGMSGGFPISAAIGRAHAMDAWGPSSGEAPHTQTFLGNPVGCAMALATLGILESEKLPERAAVEGAWWARELARLPGVAEVRGRGLMLGLDLGRPMAGARASAALLERGWIVLPCGEQSEALSLVPPLNISRELLGAAVQVLQEVLA
jgi:4-aminobutyrate aminotransferase-like enzyme